MNRVIISKKIPHFDGDSLFFDIPDSKMEDFLSVVAGQGYIVTFLNTDDLEEENDK